MCIRDRSIPGFKKEDVRIEIEKGVLKISAQSETQSEEKDENEDVYKRQVVEILEAAIKSNATGKAVKLQ